jgi:DNA segregation ATPase FtsK/SpoIIIE-like protein
MLLHPESKMWEIGSLDEVSGKTAFDYQQTDAYAKEVVDGYIRALACGIVNFANVFRPEVVLLGGGVCAQGDNLVLPLQKILDEELFAGAKGPQVKIVVAQLGNSAGILGAAALWLDEVAPSPVKECAKTTENAPALDEMLMKALRLGVENGSLSAVQLQRELAIGYNRAVNLLDKLEDMGYIAPQEEGRVRKVYLTAENFEKLYGKM